MIVVSDNDVRGAVSALRQILESDDWTDVSKSLEIQFVQLADVGLATDSPDREILIACQARDMILLTGNRTRADQTESLDYVIEELSDNDSLPVITVANRDRIVRDPNYALECAFRLLDYLSRIDELRGTRRVYLSP
jgi:hypothetical protein